MLDHRLESILSGVLQSRREQQLCRVRRAVRAIDAVHVEIDDRRYTNFCSNNYLGLTHHDRLIRATALSAQRFGAGSAASPLVCGYSDQHRQAEDALAKWKSTESAVLLSSGYQANLGAIQTLAAGAEAAGEKICFFFDKLSHASLIDAVRSAGHPFHTFAHNAIDKLARLIERSDDEVMPIVITESIFSMDGDAARLEEIVALKKRRAFVLLLDEAHASGVYGPDGAGLAAERGLSAAVDIFIVTLSKAMGLIGGAVCASRMFCDALVNLGRTYVYSTALPPAIAAGAVAALGVMHDEPQRQVRVRALAGHVRDRLKAGGWRFPEGDSPIIPITIGEADRALAAAERLAADGLLIQAIRPPTVPPAQSRLRVTLSAAHTDGEIEQLIGALAQLADA